jgi:hypothetical protein
MRCPQQLASDHEKEHGEMEGEVMVLVRFIWGMRQESLAGHSNVEKDKKLCDIPHSQICAS